MYIKYTEVDLKLFNSIQVSIGFSSLITHLKYNYFVNNYN